MSWLDYRLLTEGEVRDVGPIDLPSSMPISRAVFVNLMGADGEPMDVSGFVVGCSFSASKVSYSVAFPAAVEPRQGMRLYSVVRDIPSDLVSANEEFSWPVNGAMAVTLDDVSADTFAQIEKAAHAGACGDNDYPEPTEEQKRTGDYLKGKITLYGMPIEIEQPRGSIRSGVNDKTGVQWSNRMAAHYGEIAGSTGADGDPMDVFIGAYPEAKSIYVINQIDPETGDFDEHKLMLSFSDAEQARSAYLLSFDLNWKGLGVVGPASIDQIKWWVKNGDTTVPLTPSALPAQGYEKMKQVQWSGEEPVNVTLDAVLYDIRRHDAGGLMLDSVSVQEILDDSDGVDALDALVTPFNRLQRNMEKMQALMMRVTEDIRPVAMQITDPFKQRGVANVAVLFELSDGQTLSIFFHNPDATPNRMLPSDELISWKWMLNKKDITIVAAPEYGNELSVREVARRVMRIAAKNSPAFKRANANRAARLESIDVLKATVAAKELELKKVQHAIEVRKVDLEPSLSRAKPAAEPAVAPVVTMVEPVAAPTQIDQPESEIIASFENRGDNIEGFVTQYADGFTVSRMNYETGEVVTQKRKYMLSEKDDAIAEAKREAGFSVPVVEAAPLVDPVAPVAEMTEAPTVVVAPAVPLVEPPLATADPLPEPEVMAMADPQPVEPAAEPIPEPVIVDPLAQLVVSDPMADQAAQTGADAAATADIVADASFLQSVIDGHADIWDSELPTRLEATLASMQGDQDRIKLWNDAVNAYSKQMMSAATNKLSV